MTRRKETTLPRPRKYDHDEAYVRWQAGESQCALAREYGVTQPSLRRMLLRRDPQARAELLARKNDEQQRRYKRPCVRGCGRIAWHHMGRDGVCNECSSAERRAAALARDNHGTEQRYDHWRCRCDDCRNAKSVITALRKIARNGG